MFWSPCERKLVAVAVAVFVSDYVPYKSKPFQTVQSRAADTHIYKKEFLGTSKKQEESVLKFSEAFQLSVVLFLCDQFVPCKNPKIEGEAKEASG